MESTLLNKQVEKLEHELHQMNIYLKDIGESLRILSNRNINTIERISDNDLYYKYIKEGGNEEDDLK